MYKRSRLYSVLHNKCPRCHEGSFFLTDNPYDLRNFAKMHERCPVCNESFKKEPGYYFGAAYVSYALTVGFGIAMFLLLYVMLDFNLLPYFILFNILLVALLPVFFRTSRLIWINLFVGYKPFRRP